MSYFIAMVLGAGASVLARNLLDITVPLNWLIGGIVATVMIGFLSAGGDEREGDVE